MSTIVRGYKGNNSTNTVLLKGAPEKLINTCSAVLTKNSQEVALDGAKREALIKRIQNVAAEGYRVLGIAISLNGGNMKHITKDNARDLLDDASKYPQLESNCAFLGYVCIQDPVRPEVRKSIEDCKTAGINVIMITGDSKETAVAIAKQCNIIEQDQDTRSSCFTGSEFEKMTPDQKKNVLKGAHGKVFSRVEPRHKRELVKHLIEMVSI